MLVGLFVCSQGENKVKGLLMPLVVNEDKYLFIVEIAGMEKALLASFWEEAERCFWGPQADFSKMSSCTPSPRGIYTLQLSGSWVLARVPSRETSLLVPQMSRALESPPPLLLSQPQYFGKNCIFSLNFALWLPLNYLFPFCLSLRA